jgi:hypothetical protein
MGVIIDAGRGACYDYGALQMGLKIGEGAMGKGALAAFAVLALSACADNPPQTGADAATAVATPFYVAGKSAACAATLAVGAPLGGLAWLAPGDDARYFQGEIAHGVMANCGTTYGPLH